MNDQVRDILRRYGQTVTLRTGGGEAESRAFLQPVTQKQEQVPERMTALGAVDGRLWLYLGEAAVAGGDSVLWKGVEFRVRSSRPYYIGETLLYWWASLERAKEAAT